MQPHRAYSQGALDAQKKTDVATLRKVLDAEASVLLDQVLARGRGSQEGQSNNQTGANQHTEADGEVNHSNRMINLPAPASSQQGTTRQYATRRLTNAGRTDLLDRVKAGELSHHAAMKAAGFRKDPTPLQIILRLLPKLDPVDRLLVAQRLSQQRGRSAPRG